MPNIDTLIQIEDKNKKLLFYDRGGFVSGEESSSVTSQKFTTTPVNIDYGTVKNPRLVGILNTGTVNLTGNLLVGTDQEVAPGEFCVVSVKSSDKVETQTVKLDASSNDAKETYFKVYGEGGSWAVWFDASAIGEVPSGTEPVHGADRSVRINLMASGNVDGQTNAASMVYQLNLAGGRGLTHSTDGKTIPLGYDQGGRWFTDDFVVSYIDDTVTIKDRFTEARTNISVSTSPFTVTSTQNGTDSVRTISCQADSSLGAEALICVFPH